MLLFFYFGSCLLTKLYKAPPEFVQQALSFPGGFINSSIHLAEHISEIQSFIGWNVLCSNLHLMSISCRKLHLHTHKDSLIYLYDFSLRDKEHLLSFPSFLIISFSTRYSGFAFATMITLSYSPLIVKGVCHNSSLTHFACQCPWA